MFFKVVHTGNVKISGILKEPSGVHLIYTLQFNIRKCFFLHKKMLQYAKFFNYSCVAFFNFPQFIKTVNEYKLNTDTHDSSMDWSLQYILHKMKRQMVNGRIDTYEWLAFHLLSKNN